jgi:cephalosporin-C deacetylase-like acetyl esterase
MVLGVLTFQVARLTLADDAGDLSRLSTDVLTNEQRSEATGMIERDIERRAAEVNARHRAEWSQIKTPEQWEEYRDARIARLRRSLGDYPPPPAKLNSRVTGTLDGDGFRIENVVYESRPGQWVPGNLYVPAKPAPSMPGIVLAHAHHRDKPQSELQDMGMTWSRAGCLVLVIDQVGFGERRAHPFQRDEDYAKPYRTTRQDYYFRYDSGVQLQLLGDSLMGWMAWDLMRGVDLLLGRQGVDPQRIILLGAVAGGGDPAAVTAALDRRIAGCVPFNFGGPQPETGYPLPEDADRSFDLLGGSYWDSTRGLRLGGRDDFLPWLIVASTAPRHLVHAHEFSWDRDRDPVWKRYQQVWGQFYNAADKIGFAHGYGTLREQASQASHCTNIGRVHRRMIHPLFERWFGIQVAESDEYSHPRKPEELVCLTEKARGELRPKSLTEVMSAIGLERIDAARRRLAGKADAERRQLLRDDWSRLLGPVTPVAPPVIKRTSLDDQPVAGAKVERLVLEAEPGIWVPVVVLSPVKATGRALAVVGVAQAGKAGFVQQRGPELLTLVQHGAIVVLPDLRGTGESRTGSSRGRDSGATNLSVHVQLFGETLLGQRLRDLRSVLVYLRERRDVDPQRIALWGDSFAPPNPADTDFQIPHGVDGWPQESEPLGGLLALLGALFEDEIRAVYVAGGLNEYHAVLTHFAVLIPHDGSVPGALTAGDLCDLAGSLTPKPVCLEALVDHLNRTVSAAEMLRAYAPAVQAYAATPQALSLEETRSSSAVWLLEQLSTAKTVTRDSETNRDGFRDR